MFRFGLLVSISALASLVAGLQPVWSQCGGIGWTGGTTCVAGTTCTWSNNYFSQCIPSPASQSTLSGPSSTLAPPAPVPTSSPAPAAGKANFWFSFGDSYTQTGFDPTGVLPTVGNPLGNPPYPGWTATGGTNWIDVDTTVYNKSLVLTYNYAYGGATIDANLVTPYMPTVLSLTDQVNQFLNGAASKPSTAAWTSDNALFSFWIGINDIGNSYYLSGSRDAFSDTLLDAYFALVQKLYNVGARNFLFVNVPPIDRSPLMLAQAASAQASEKAVIAGFNSKLSARAQAFQAANAGVKTWMLDSNKIFTDVLNNPQASGFVDAVSYGGANNFWGNNYHPSSAFHEILGKQAGQLLANTVW